MEDVCCYCNEPVKSSYSYMDRDFGIAHGHKRCIMKYVSEVKRIAKDRDISIEKARRMYSSSRAYVENVETLLIKLGISLRDYEGNFKNVNTVLAELSNVWDKLSRDQKDKLTALVVSNDGEGL